MQTTIPGLRVAGGVLLSLALMLVISGVLLLAGFSPVFLTGSSIIILSLAVGQRTGWAVSIPASLILLLGAATVLLRAAPVTGINLGLLVFGVMFLVDVLALALMLRHLPSFRFPGRAAGAGAFSAGAVSILAGIGLLATVGAGASMRVGWAMNNDVVWNTVASRLILQDNGIDPNLHPNPSPLMNGLMALWSSPGRGAADELLRHDVTRQTELWLLLIVLSSALAGLIGARAVGEGRPVMRALAGAFAAVLPLSWYATGFMVQFGFLNVALSLVVLFACWLLWQETHRRPAFSVALLMVASTILLACWAPLAVLPLALAGGGILSEWRTLLPRRGHLHSWWVVGAILQLPVYVLVVTLPDLFRDGGALAANGAAPALAPLDIVLAWALVFVTGTLAAVGLGRRQELLGIVLVIGSSVFALTYLVIQRLGVDSAWGYYPAKFGWMVSILLVVILAGSIFAWLREQRTRGWLGIAVLLSAALVTGLVVAKVPPVIRNAQNIFPLAGIAMQSVSSEGVERTDALFAAAERGTLTVFSGFSENAADDVSMNFWLLQLKTTRSDDPLRTLAYAPDADSPMVICAAAQLWSGETIVVTRDAQLESELARSCATPLTVELREQDAG